MNNKQILKELDEAIDAYERVEAGSLSDQQLLELIRLREIRIKRIKIEKDGNDGVESL